MKILIVALDFPPSTGGISTYTKETAASLSKIVDVTVLAAGVSDPKNMEQNFPYPIKRTLAFPILRYLSFFVFLPWLVWRYKFDAVLHTVWPTALISHVFYFCIPVPYFVSIHASEILDDQTSWKRRLKSYLRSWKIAALRKAKGIFPVSHYSSNIASSFGVNIDRIKVIPNGVNTEIFKPAIKNKLKGHTPTLLTVARLDLHKGHDRVLEALALLKKEGVVPNYVIVGTGDEETRLRKMVFELGLESQVSFVGYVPSTDLPAWYSNSDIFVMASREIKDRLDLIEGFGISFLEASASGLPVIAGNSGGVSDAVMDNKTGFLVNPNDPSDIARAIKKIITNPALAEDLGRSGRQWTETEMNWDKVAIRLYGAIQILMSS